MKSALQKLMLSILSTSLFAILLYYIINTYDPSGTIINKIHNNPIYLFFLFLSIVACLSLYTNQNKKSKFIVTSIIFINFLYIIFIYLTSQTGLNSTQGLFLVGFLVLIFISNYIKNWFGYTITAISLIGILSTIFLSIIPMYETGPDILNFQNNFSTKIITYSKVQINEGKASLQVDKKSYQFGNGLTSHDLKINKSGSTILFKSNQKYLNTFGYLLFPNKDIVQIYPQSAIKIFPSNQIEIIAGTIKHNEDPNIIFTGKTTYGIINPKDEMVVIDFYDTQLQQYIINKAGGIFATNKTINNISHSLLSFLSKIFPTQFEDNLKNFYEFQKYLNNTTKTQQNIIKFNQNDVKNSFFKNISDSLETTKIIK